MKITYAFLRAAIALCDRSGIKKIVVKFAPLLWLCAACLCAAATPTPIDKLLHVHVPMRDGVRLDTNIFHPSGTARFPVILVRTPYGKGHDLPSGYGPFVDHG